MTLIIFSNIKNTLVENYLIIINQVASNTPCHGGGFLGFPTWYKYLKTRETQVDVAGSIQCSPHLTKLSDIWLIALAVVEILLRVVVLLAIIYVLIGGIKYINSRGNADKVSSAKSTIIDALTGLIIAIIAISLINFIGRQFSATP